MNALGNSKKRRLPIKQRELINKENAKAYSKEIRKAEESMQFMLTVSLLRTLEEDYGYGAVRRDKFLSCFINRCNELSDYLVSNKCIEGDSGTEVYDKEYNLQIFHELAEQYGIKFDESIFDY